MQTWFLLKLKIEKVRNIKKKNVRVYKTNKK